MKFNRAHYVYLVFALLLLAPYVLQAQDTCNLDSAEAYTDRGLRAFNSQNYDDAAANFACAITLEPDNGDHYFNLAASYWWQSKVDDALAQLAIAHETIRDYEPAFSLAGDIYTWQGEYEDALEMYTAALAVDPDSAFAHYGRGYVYSVQGRNAEAIIEYDAAIASDNTLAESYLGRAWAYLLTDQPQFSHADFLRWINLTEVDGVRDTLDDILASGNLSIAEGKVYHLTFTADTGTIFSAAAITRDAADPLLVLLAPDGTAIQSDDDGGVNFNALLRNIVLPETGTYTLVIGQAGAYNTGMIELAIRINDRFLSTNPGNTRIADNFAVYNLYVNETAEVFTTGGDRLNVRSGPGQQYSIITQLEPGEQVTLLEGPNKENGYSWWYIRTSDGTEGWAVERVIEEQTLQLALTSGETALVTSGEEKLNVRAEASRSAAVAFQLDDGAQVTLLDEPVIADNLRWWHIRDDQGREGWAVDRIELERTLIPLREVSR